MGYKGFSLRLQSINHLFCFSILHVEAGRRGSEEARQFHFCLKKYCNWFHSCYRTAADCRWCYGNIIIWLLYAGTKTSWLDLGTKLQRYSRCSTKMCGLKHCTFFLLKEVVNKAVSTFLNVKLQRDFWSSATTLQLLDIISWLTRCESLRGLRISWVGFGWGFKQHCVTISMDCFSPLVQITLISLPPSLCLWPQYLHWLF